jgi:glycosyltransferase involved in cell wall biosynthesis
LVRRTLPFVSQVYVVDDGCPDGCGERVGETSRVTVLRNQKNLGVGGAMKRGYAEALRDGADIVVKIDADDQMDPASIPLLTRRLLLGKADYTKGNRFAPLHRMPTTADSRPRRPMPTGRRLGNNLISFVHKGVTGYWNIFDPANGYTAIHRRALEIIDLQKVANGYFFETDMLFQLNLVDAVVADVPLPALYADEQSGLRIGGVVRDFPRLALQRFAKRLWLKYFLQDFNVASMEMLLGLPLVLFGVALGIYHWIDALGSGVPSTAGTVMFAALPIIIGFQLLLSAVSYDIHKIPDCPLSSGDPPGS